MDSKRTWIIVGFLMFAGSIFFFMSYDNNEIISIKKGSEVVEAPLDRIWNEEILGAKITLNSAIVDSVFRGVGMKIINDKIYVTDYGDMRLKQFSSRGEFLQSFGKGEGEGPGEFVQMMDFTVHPSGTLYVQDVRKFELSLFDDKNTSYLLSRKIDYIPHRLINVEDYLVAHTGMADNLFRLYDASGQYALEFGNIMQNQPASSLTLSGEIVAVNDSNYFIYSPSMASFLFYFDLNGSEILRVITPDRIPFREPIATESGTTKVVRPAQVPVRVFGLDVFRDKLLVNAMYAGDSGRSRYSFIDVYQLQTGEYIESFRMPSLTEDIAVTDEYFYYLDQNSESVKAFSHSL